MNDAEYSKFLLDKFESHKGKYDPPQPAIETLLESIAYSLTSIANSLNGEITVIQSKSEIDESVNIFGS